jgi:hypothetical protein
VFELFSAADAIAAVAAAGVNLTIKGAQLATFPLSISASNLQAAITKALNGSAVGVEVIQNPAAGTLTYRLLTNRTAFPDDLSPADISVQLVVLPASNSASGSTNGSTTGSTSGSSSTGDSNGTSPTCLKLVAEARTVTYINADGTNSSMTVFEEVWQNITVTTHSSSNISRDLTANASLLLADDGTALNAAAEDDADVLAGLSIEVSQPLEPPPPGGQPRGAWQLRLEDQSEVIITVKG